MEFLQNSFQLYFFAPGFDIFDELSSIYQIINSNSN